MEREKVILIKNTTGWQHLNLHEIWLYRELFYFLTWRDLKIRYKQTVIGVSWVLLQPLLTMLIFSVVLGTYAHLPSEGVPYPIFVFIGLLPWTFFSQSLARCSESIVANSSLISKIYFPRLISPMAASMAALVDFFIAIVILVGLMCYYRVIPRPETCWFPFFVVILFIFSTGVGLWLAALNVMYRDIRYVVPFVIQVGMFITPVVYPVSMVSGPGQWLLYLNPMAGLIEGFRSIILGRQPMPVLGLVMATGISLALFVSGVYFFRRMERKFADLI